VSLFRKKPLIVEAHQVPDPNTNPDHTARSVVKLAEWCDSSATIAYDGPGTHRWVIRIETLEGVMQAEPGDWIIKGVNGEFYPCKPDIFAKTYEVAD
jgi:hypothetical protein